LVVSSVVAASCASKASSSSNGCQTLTACCAVLGGSAQQACIEAAAAGSASSCASDLSLYQSMGLCSNVGSGTGSGSGSSSSPGGACVGLTTCCAKLSGATATTCDETVAANSAAACSALLEVYSANGSCSATGSGPGRDGGARPDGGRDGTVDSSPSSGDGGQTTDPTTCAAAAAARSYIGCDFWPTVTTNLVWSGFDFTAVVANVQSVPVTVSVTGPAGYSAMVTVPANTLTDVYLPWVPALKGPDVTGTDTTFPNSVGVRGGAYHLVSSGPVAVYQFNALEYQGVGGPPGKSWATCPNLGATGCFSFSNDASLLFPSTSMTGNYRVTGEHSSSSQGGGVMAITATENGTNVTVQLSSTATVVASAALTVVDGGAADAGAVEFPIPAGTPGGTMSFALGAGDVVQLIASASDTSDLSGSLVSANKPVQVISARQCANQPDPIAACDHLEANVLPVETLGKDYVVTVPTSPHKNLIGHKVRFYGNTDGTVLTYSPMQPAGCPSTLNAGQVVECLSTPACAKGTDNSSTDGMQGDPVTVACVTQSFEVTGTHEFAVSSFMLGGSAVDLTSASDAQEGDPSMSPMVPTEQYRSKYSFLAPTDYEESYADIVMPTGTVLTLDGAPVPDDPSGLNASWLIVRVTLTAGSAAGAHVITGTKPFGVQVIGYGTYTSYQYPAGLDLGMISPP
jgi:hypothetical protein